MGKISLDLTTIKAAGVYTLEIDNSTRTTITTNSLRLIPGFSNKGPFNRPVFLLNDNDRLSIFGDIDSKLEHKGCYFNRMMRTLLQDGPIIALNLLSVDNSYNGPDQVNFTAMSLDAATANPKVSGSKKYGEYDYHANTLDKSIYGTKDGDMIPYVGNTPFSSLYNRSRFWIPDKDLLTSVASKALGTLDYATGSGSYEYTNFLNFANVGTEEFSILVFKPENLAGYDITAESWYGSQENIPFGWIRPSDYISDYFLQVVCVKGNWSNYPVLSTDPMWKAYFDKNGIIKSRINNFINAEGVTLIGSWMGCIIPDFVNKQGDNLSLENKINARTEITGLLMSFNEDAAHVVAGDYTGPDSNENDDDFENEGVFTWGIDIDGDREIDSDNGEGIAPYIIDMVGHGAFVDGQEDNIESVEYEFLKTEGFEATINGKQTVCLMPYDTTGEMTVTVKVYTKTDKDGNTTILTDEADIFLPQEITYTKGSAELGKLTFSKGTPTIPEDFPTGKVWSNYSKDTAYETWILNKNVVATPTYHIDGKEDEKAEGVTLKEEPNVKPGIYIPEDFIEDIEADYVKDGVQSPLNITFNATWANNRLIGRTYYKVSLDGVLSADYLKTSDVKIVYFDLDGTDTYDPELNTADADLVPITSISDLEPFCKKTNAADDNTLRMHTMKIAFNIDKTTFFAFFRYTALKKNNLTLLQTFEPGVANASVYTAGLTSLEFFHADDEKDYIASGIVEVDGETYVNVSITDQDCDCEYKNLHYIVRPDKSGVSGTLTDNTKAHTIGFLSYAYVEDLDEIDPDKKPSLQVDKAYYFSDPTLWGDSAPVTDINKNMFIVVTSGTSAEVNDGWNAINVGTFVRNITYHNNPGEANSYKVVPGITRVIRKQFVPVSYGRITYNGKTYDYFGETCEAKNGVEGFYLYTTVDPVLIEHRVDKIQVNGETVDNEVSYITRQLPLTNDVISSSLRFIPMKGLKITSRHRPGYAADGTISIEGGIEKIYSVLTDNGIRRGLCNPTMVDFRYIVDCMSYGLESSLGGKVYLSQLAQDRGSCLAILNLPSAKQFAVSSNPIFCDAYTTGSETRPSFDTKYIPQGGNQEMGSSRVFSLPDENDGSKYAAAFFPNLIYTEGGRKISVPPAADVCNVLASKFTGVNSPYGICANLSGIIRNRYVSDLEFDADTDDRGYLEPFGVNTIIKESGYIMIYGNQTCYQTLKSDMNKLHVRENLNTIEIECTAVLKRFNFLYNTAQTRAQIVQALTPVLSVMQVSGAIDSYNITCDETNNTAEIIESDFGIVDIDVWFNHGMEKILTRIKVNRYGSNQSAD